MKHIIKYSKYNEGLVSYFKGIFNGVKNDDDEIAKDILTNIKSVYFDDMDYDKLYFNYNNYNFICHSQGYAYFYGNDISSDDQIMIESDILRRIYKIGMNTLFKRKVDNVEISLQKEREKKESKTLKYIESKGGFINLMDNYINELSKGFFGLDINNPYLKVKDKNSIEYTNDVIFLRGVPGIGLSIERILFKFSDSELIIRINVNEEFKINLNNYKEWYDYMVELRNKIIEYNKLKLNITNNKKRDIINKFRK